MLRASRRDARPHAGDYPEPVLLGQTRAARTRERVPQSGPECRAGGVAEPGRHDAYDGVRRRIESDRLTDGGAGPTEARLPERVTEHSNGSRPRVILGLQEGATKQRVGSQEWEEARGDRPHLYASYLADSEQAGIRSGVGGRFLQHVSSGAPRLIGGDSRGRASAVLREHLLQIQQSIRAREWQGPDQYALDHAEHRRVGADPEGEREYRNGGESRALGERAQRVAEVVHRGSGVRGRGSGICRGMRRWALETCRTL